MKYNNLRDMLQLVKAVSVPLFITWKDILFVCSGLL